MNALGSTRTPTASPASGPVVPRSALEPSRWPASACDVYVREVGKIGGGRRAYMVEVDGKILDQFTATGPYLTWSQMDDIAAGYREAING